MRSDYHVHLERGPWTLEWLSRFVARARAQGIGDLGFSEHPHRFHECRAMYPPREATGGWVDGECTESLESYLRLIEDARRAGLPVKLGMEWDFLPGYEGQLERVLRAYPWDYAIGSVHWLPPREEGEPWWGFDNPEWDDEWSRRDPREVYRQYFQLIEAAARTGFFDWIGHADVIKVFGHRPAEDVADLYESAARAFAGTGVCAEINTAGWRKPVGEIYPAPGFLRACFRAGVPTLINSDAHVPDDVGRDFDRAVEIARAAGYADAATFTRRERTMRPLP